MSAVIEPPVETIDKHLEELDTVTIRFAGDSGDGMQLTGTQFTNTSAIVGNDISTLPDFPAEIRAPAGSLPGVSGFQLNFSNHDIRTPGDQPGVLVAMNPAALKVNLPDLEEGGTLIINSDEFTKENLEHAAYRSNPLEDGSLTGYRVHTIAGERPVFQRVRPVSGVFEILLGELVTVNDQRAAFFEIGQVHFQRGRVHGHQNAGLIAGRANVVVRKIQLKAADTRQTAGGRANLSRKIRQRRDVIADNRRRVRELRAGQLHAVARITGEANCYCV